MSSPYVVAIWDGPVPSHDKAASARYEELIDAHFGADAPGDPTPRREPPTAAIAGLIAVLLRRWPEAGDAETPWTEGPLASLASGPVIEIPLEDSDALPFIARESQRLGLVCYDLQGPPYVIRPAMAEHMVATTPIGLRQAVSDGLVAAGYKRAGHGFHTRRIDDDFCTVVDTGRTSRQADAVSPWVGLHSHRVGNLEAELIGVPAAKEDFETVGSPLGDWFGPSFAGVVLPRSSQLGNAREIVDRIEGAAGNLGEFAQLARLPEYPGGISHYIRRLSVAVLLGDAQGMAKALTEAERDCAAHEGLCDQYRRLTANTAARIGPDLDREVAALRAEMARQPAPRSDDRIGLVRRIFRRS